MHWLLRLAKYDFEVKYKKDKLNTQSDAIAMSRTNGRAIPDEKENIPYFFVDEQSVGDKSKFLDPDYTDY